MKLMEFLLEEYDYPVTELYTLSGDDAVRLTTILESYTELSDKLDNLRSKRLTESRDYQWAMEKFTMFESAYNELIEEFDQNYLKK